MNEDLIFGCSVYIMKKVNYFHELYVFFAHECIALNLSSHMLRHLVQVSSSDEVQVYICNCQMREGSIP